MSFILFDQQSCHLNGFYLYDAHPDWALKGPEESNHRIIFKCHSDEGSGTWLGFNLADFNWGAILRRNDAPYNDCLPPTEQILESALTDSDSLNAMQEHIFNDLNNGFFNPSNTILGSLTDEGLNLVKGSFNPGSTPLKPGRHVLEDNGKIDDPGSPQLTELWSQSNVWTDEQLKNLAGQWQCEDGMRKTRAAVIFTFSPGRLNLQYNLDLQNKSEWVSADYNTD